MPDERASYLRIREADLSVPLCQAEVTKRPWHVLKNYKTNCPRGRDDKHEQERWCKGWVVDVLHFESLAVRSLSLHAYAQT